MGVGTFICQVHQVPQKRNVVQMVLCLLLVAALMKHWWWDFALDDMPLFMRMVTTTRKFCQDCTKYNNLFAMAATKVCNYCDNPGFTNWGPGIHCVMLSRRVHHFFKRVSSSNPQVVDYHILFLTVKGHVHVCLNLEMLTKKYWMIQLMGWRVKIHIQWFTSPWDKCSC